MRILPVSSAFTWRKWGISDKIPLKKFFYEIFSPPCKCRWKKSNFSKIAVFSPCKCRRKYRKNLVQNRDAYVGIHMPSCLFCRFLDFFASAFTWSGNRKIWDRDFSTEVFIFHAGMEKPRFLGHFWTKNR